ncbi:MAG: homocysteine S-methyltransferase family protein, partial [Lachnoclostridium sp.]|nr:homocysteine S-methyltransferase family protein [Lachnoclostridium sp.]
MGIHKLLNKGFIILDGATGTNLQKQGMASGDCPELWILGHKEVFLELQKGYIQSGCDILFAPTFTCNAVKLNEYGVKDRQEELTKDLISLSKQAVLESDRKKPVYIAGDLSMTGEQLTPMGQMTFEELVDIYKEQVRYCVDGGVDLFVIETMMSLQESRAALLAVKETCRLP